jgi:WXG100 family type VII secretion target
MSDDLINYDYDAIDECLAMMSQRINEIEAETDGLGADVKRIMVDWQGSTAERYDQIAADLHSDLDQNKNNLNDLMKNFEGAKLQMQHADKAGAKMN